MPVPSKLNTTTNLQHFNWGPTETMQRDKEQSRQLHEPRFRMMTTDPISGIDVDDYMSHTSLLVGNMTIYFETEENCKAYRDMPVNHPNEHLPFAATDDDDRGG